MKTRHLTITTENGKHILHIFHEDDPSDDHFELSALQIMLLAYQANSIIWSYYKLVPRD